MNVYSHISRSMYSNSFLLVNEERKEAAIIDPGTMIPAFEKILEEEHIRLTHVLLTHGHYDHMHAALYYKDKFQAKLCAGEKERVLLEDPQLNLSGQTSVICDQYFTQGDVIEPFGLYVEETPGHTEGSVCYRLPGIVFSGDLIFRESVGRWDLPTGNLAKLRKSLKKMLNEPDDTVFHTGHGVDTTVGHERVYNPFITD